MTRGGRWALVLYWALGIGHSMVIGYLVIGHFPSFIIRNSSLIPHSDFGIRNLPFPLFAYLPIA